MNARIVKIRNEVVRIFVERARATKAKIFSYTGDFSEHCFLPPLVVRTLSSDNSRRPLYRANEFMPVYLSCKQEFLEFFIEIEQKHGAFFCTYHVRAHFSCDLCKVGQKLLPRNLENAPFPVYGELLKFVCIKP